MTTTNAADDDPIATSPAEIARLTAERPDATVIGVHPANDLADYLRRLQRGWPHRVLLAWRKVLPMEAFAGPAHPADVEPYALDSLVCQALAHGYQPYAGIALTWQGIPPHLAGGRPEHLKISTLPIDDLPEVDVTGPLALGSAVLCTATLPALPWTDEAYETALTSPPPEYRADEQDRAGEPAP